MLKLPLPLRPPLHHPSLHHTTLHHTTPHHTTPHHTTPPHHHPSLHHTTPHHTTPHHTTTPYHTTQAPKRKEVAVNLKGLDDTEKDLLEFNKNERDKMEQEIEELRRRSVSGGVVVWWCGGVVVWWCGGVVVWWRGGVM